MMRSLYSGVAGLRTHQTKMDVIGNNIANVNTVGFKAQSVTFSDVLYQTTQNASGANEETGAGGTNAKQIGLGSSVSAISTKITETGGYQSTNNPFDLMINGDQFFIVQNNGVNYFTKAGNFAVDSNGTLVTSQGYSVMGWKATDGVVRNDVVQKINLYDASAKYAAPKATERSTITGNINKEDENFTVIDGAQNGRKVNVSFYDNLGYKYQATLQFTKNSDYEYAVKATAVSCNGQEMNLTDEQLAALIDADAVVSFDASTGELAADAAASIVLNTSTLGIAAMPGDVIMDVSQMQCRGTETAIDSERGTKDTAGNVVGAGSAVGTMTEVGIQKDGKIVATYDNGDQQVIYQIAVASFVNAAGLEKSGDNLFKATLNSGEFNGIGEDITANGGYFTTGVLEMSNVDLASEFTDMITTQRGYQANSRIITVSDSLLEELINLKR